MIMIKKIMSSVENILNLKEILSCLVVPCKSYWFFYCQASYFIQQIHTGDVSRLAYNHLSMSLILLRFFGFRVYFIVVLL